MFRSIPAAFAALCFVTAAQAHFIWIELPPELATAAHMRFAEEPGEATSADMQALAAPMAVKTAGGDAVTFAPGDDALTAAVAEDVAAAGGTLDYGVLDRSEGGRGVFMLVYHAKAARTLADAAEPMGLPLEVIASEADGTVTVTVLHNGEPAAGAELQVFLPAVLEPAETTTGTDGKATFDVSGTDWLGVRAMVPEEKSGEHDGKAYDLVHHYSTLTTFYAGK